MEGVLQYAMVNDNIQWSSQVDIAEFILYIFVWIMHPTVHFSVTQMNQYTVNLYLNHHLHPLINIIHVMKAVVSHQVLDIPWKPWNLENS